MELLLSWDLHPGACVPELLLLLLPLVLCGKMFLGLNAVMESFSCSGASLRNRGNDCPSVCVIFRPGCPFPSSNLCQFSRTMQEHVHQGFMLPVVSLSSIRGTGPDGSIVKADIEEYLASGSASKRPSAPEGQKPAVGRAGAAPITEVDYTDIPNTQIRRVTAKRLLLSKQTIPHYYLSLDTRVDKLLKLRAELNAVLESSKTKDAPVKKISLNDFVIKAVALALQKVPECNSSWSDDFIRQYHNVNISVAVQTEHGLMVPVVKDADKKGLSTISEDVKVLAGKARSNTLKPQDYEGGTFTVSNLGGSFGIKQFCAIINPPQACILAVGTTEKQVIPGDGTGSLLTGTFMTVTLSCDHRVVDGAIGAQWLGAFKSYIENPVTLIL